MKYSQLTGFIAALALISVCFMPWAYIASLQTEITGMNTTGTRFGRPGLLLIVLASLSGLLFLIPKIWAKRVNVMLGAVILAWSIRNYLLIGTCSMGECPEKKAGLYLLLLLSGVVMLMSLLPKLPVVRTPAE